MKLFVIKTEVWDVHAMAVYTVEEVNHHCKVEISISPLFEMMACLRSVMFH